MKFLILKYKTKYTREKSIVDDINVVIHESWYQIFGIKFSRNRFIVGYEPANKEKL